MRFLSMRMVALSVVFSMVMAPVASAATIQSAPIRINASTNKSFFGADVTSTVSRGDFVRVLLQQLRYSLLEETNKSGFKRVPTSLVPYVETAYAHGALRVFGRSLYAGRAITRSEAVQVVADLEADGDQPKMKTSFSDVPAGTPEARAVGIAIERGWVKADTSILFGGKRVLTVKEANQIILAVLNSENLSPTTTQTIVVPILNIGSQRSSKTLPKENIQRAVWDLLNTDYLYKDRVQDDKAGTASIQGLLEGLKDPYTVYMPPAKSQSFQADLEGNVTGIGAQVEQKDKFLVIIAPLPGSPAEKAGLRAGDIILEADGTDLTVLSLDDAISKVRGPKGSTAVLKIERDGTKMMFNVVRDAINVLEDQVSWQGTVAVVKILQFGATTEREIRSTFTDVMKKNPTGVILDLRNDPGGLLDAAGVVSSVFLPKGSTYVTITSKGVTTKEITTEEAIVPATVRMAVLVNKGSASASEIVAGALQDAGRAKLIGQKTFGKFTVQQIFNFDDGSSLKMTIAAWGTPNGRNLDGVGVTPDILVPDSNGGRDEQLLRAVDTLR